MTYQRSTSTRSHDTSTARPTLAAYSASYYIVCVLMHLVHIGSSQSCLSCLVTATGNMPFRNRLRSADTDSYTNCLPPDLSLANDVFHTLDPKLGINCLPSFRT